MDEGLPAAFARPGSWYLGGGGPLLWAPPFPRFLHRPGFWDRAQYFGFALEPGFTVAVLDGRGRELPLVAEGRETRLGVLTRRYRVDADIGLIERRSVTPPGAMVSALELENGARQPARLSVVAWTAQPVPIAVLDGRHVWARTLEHPRVPSFDVGLALGLAPAPTLLASQPSEPVPPLPDWILTPFAYLPPGADGWRSAAQPPESGAPGLTFAAQRLDLELAPGQRRVVRVALGVGPTDAAARARLERVLADDPEADAERAWRRFLARVPRFACSDPYLESAYWNRWRGLALNAVETAEGAYRHPFVCEGIDYFRAPISYSAPAIMREVRWLDRPDLGRGLVRTFLDHQHQDGSLPGHVFASGVRPESFYHADWGAALTSLDLVHPDDEFVAEVYPAFERYAEYLRRARDPDHSGLVDVWNQFETGQEYSPRYTFAQPAAGDADWGRAFRLKGVDVTVYALGLYRWLADHAAHAGRSRARTRWAAQTRHTGRALLDACWDPARGLFVDVLPGSLARSPVRAAIGFYPFLTDLPAARHLRAIHQHLLDPAGFWTAHPVPTVSLDDPLFSADGIWRGVRRNCPWNGRTWPMVNSHVAEALVKTAERLDPSLLPAATDLITRCIRTLFWDGDPARPNGFEHYHPLDGSPSAYRGIDDYLHSWLVDLIIQYACGLRPAADAIRVRPLPFGLARFELEGAPLRGHRIDLAWSAGAGLRLYRDGRPAGQRDDLGPLAAPLDEAG